jgi:hypothetical protein
MTNVQVSEVASNRRARSIRQIFLRSPLSLDGRWPMTELTTAGRDFVPNKRGSWRTDEIIPIKVGFGRAGTWRIFVGLSEMIYQLRPLNAYRR